ncbi:2-desacetyl-2-hydroxyethyl bacteriochlorophyllide A dehydrogenase [Limimaricola variabilis]|uniref:2-desacetyl-2-hydroxyethyl bacteriochlorophyllide A dehydrogenase n=1 Tax=Limimaricola variabilis TaxID=1492771 RepID=A0ABR6HR61_9RHOB|nr:alcohol dehydrogenase catalytic domain-containing protein [Limimaricola variabilis]MBB3713035.1 2-desacetyl-2-hydroxyethyl bacteriochlorophyllide A dehydrogenase [Limimaricola variabilis]
MEAMVYEALGRAEVANIAPPQPSAKEVLLRCRASGVCHTDIDILHGRYGEGRFPLVPGHEYAGEVVEVGEEVQAFKAGDRVVVDPNISCGSCRPCRKGLTNLCQMLGAYGVTRNGGFAEFSVVQESNLVSIGDMPFAIAALAEPMGCVLNGIEAVGSNSVERALIFGAGPIGLLMAIALRTRGVSDIHVADIDGGRLELAESFGFRPLLSEGEALKPLLGQMDLSVDATGRPAVAESLVRYTANGGKVLFFGVCAPEAKISVSPYEIFRRQITMAGAHSLNHNIDAALEAIRSFGPDIGRLVSHQLPLSEIPDLISGRGPDKTLKVQATW